MGRAKALLGHWVMYQYLSRGGCRIGGSCMRFGGSMALRYHLSQLIYNSSVRVPLTAFL